MSDKHLTFDWLDISIASKIPISTLQLTPPPFKLRAVVTPTLVGSGYKVLHSMIYAKLPCLLVHRLLEMGPVNKI